MTENNKIRYAIDTNVLGYLAMACLCDKKQFFYYNNFSETTYQNLLWLAKMVDLGKIELVVPLTVFREVIRKPQINLSSQKAMTADKMTRINNILFFKKTARKYLEKNENIKIAYVDEGFIGPYKTKFFEIANAYVEDPQFPNNLPLSFEIRQKPFLRDDPKKFPHDAQIMAESALLGLQLISFDHHLVGKRPFNIPVRIRQINQEILGTNASAISFDNFIKIIKREGTFLPYINKDYTHTILPVFVESISYLPHRVFNKKVKEVTSKKHLFHEELNKILDKKDLFDFLITPLDLENLEDSAKLQEQKIEQEEKRIREKYLENLEIANQRTLFLKYLDSPLPLDLITQKQKAKIETKKTIKTKIKLDLFSPDAEKILDNIFGSKTSETCHNENQDKGAEPEL